MHKRNITFIPKVNDELRKRGIDVEFILTINQNDFTQNISKEPLAGIVNIGSIAPEYCPYVYQNCDAVFVPTLLETFSAIYPEAMASKKPIISSNLPFAKGICQDAALYYQYDSVKDAADKIELIMNSPDLVQKLIENGVNQLKTFDTPFSRFQKILDKALKK